MSERKEGNGYWKTAGGIGALLAALSGKLKFLLPLLKLGKAGGTIWSMALMVGAYALIYPWTFAVGIVVMLFFHEMGHVWAAGRKGLPVSAPAFIPFLGALITLKKQPADAKTEAYVAFGGPLVGSIAALLAFLAAKLTGYRPLYAIAQVGFFLNLINLLPIHPLDGGRIVTAISRWLWAVGLIGGLVIILYLKAVVFLFFWALFAWELYQKFVREAPAERKQVVKWTVDAAVFDEAGILIPAEEHRRELPFVQYCTLADQQHICAVDYPGIGKIGEFPFGAGRIEQVELFRTIRQRESVTFLVRVAYTADARYAAIREEEYYRVSAKTRIVYGLAYFGLAAVLGWLMYETAMTIPKPPLTG
ncbi:site-2 protease family protein [Effusibacillus pohliae]|uniref:site-2 protease family protein n=1 Tax=Effusibacillus pohliae TaxID=232270 RepID=UPI00036C5071|nr:site-2 protease family protein [Effusibacillus pohliae]